MTRKHSGPNRNRESGPKLTLYHNGNSFQVKVEQIATDTLDFDAPLICPHCDAKLKVTTELISFGSARDKHTYTLLCKRCLVGFMYIHNIDHEEVYP